MIDFEIKIYWNEQNIQNSHSKLQKLFSFVQKLSHCLFLFAFDFVLICSLDLLTLSLFLSRHNCWPDYLIFEDNWYSDFTSLVLLSLVHMGVFLHKQSLVMLFSWTITKASQIIGLLTEFLFCSTKFMYCSTYSDSFSGSLLVSYVNLFSSKVRYSLRLRDYCILCRSLREQFRSKNSCFCFKSSISIYCFWLTLEWTHLG